MTAYDRVEANLIYGTSFWFSLTEFIKLCFLTDFAFPFCLPLDGVTGSFIMSALLVPPFLHQMRIKQALKLSERTPYNTGLTNVLRNAMASAATKWYERRKKFLSSFARLPSMYMSNITTVMGSHMTKTTITFRNSTLTTLMCLFSLISSCCDIDPCLGLLLDPLGEDDEYWAENFLVQGTNISERLSSLCLLVWERLQFFISTALNMTHDVAHAFLVDRIFWNILW